MKNNDLNMSQLARAVRYALVAGLVAGVGVSPAVAQDDAVQLDKVEVTGSRIKRVDVEGPLPLTVFTREDIEASGSLNIADFIRETNFNSFGSFDASSGFAGGAQGTSVVDLRGLGSGRTLVLIDGRRIAGAPSFFGGGAQNLNGLPLAAIERIEVLRDGASAVYGADAIGGVINVITRKDFDGLQVSTTYTAPSQPGGDERYGSITGGISSGRGNVIFTIDHYERDIVFRADRPYIFNQTPSTLGFPGSFLRRDPVTGATVGLWSPDPRCPTAFDSDPNFPDSARQEFPGLGTFCMFRFTSQAGQTAAIDRDTATLFFNYNLTDDIQAFGRTSYSRNGSFGRFASAPAIFPRFIGPTNPNNPTLGELGPGQGYLLDLRFRFVPLGARDSVTVDNVVENLYGIRGTMDFAGGADWELTAFHNRYRQLDIGEGYGLISTFFDVVADGSFNPFGALNPAVTGQVAHTTITNNQTRDFGVDGRLNFSLFEMAAGPAGFATGFEYRDTQFSAFGDAQSNAGNVFGSAGGSANGERALYSVFVEALFPILDNLELGAAARYDSYNDFGSDVSPKISVLWRPLDTLVVRASVGEGFRAPDLENVGRLRSQSFPAFVDQFGCSLAPTNTFLCTSQQREIEIGGNPNLGAENSRQYSLGFVWNVLDNLSVGIDHYRIELENGIGSVPLSQIMANELRCRTGQEPCIPGLLGNVVRDTNQQLIIVRVVPTNFSGIVTKGYDGDISYRMDTDYGRFAFSGSMSFVDEYTLRTLTSADLAGTAFAPKRRASMGVNWSYGDYGATLNGSYVGASCSFGGGSTGACEDRIGSFTTFDLQGSWETPWKGQIALGVRNLADRDPPLDAFGEGDYGLTPLWGRVPYIRYTQNF